MAEREWHLGEEVETVGELRRLIADIPDDTRVYAVLDTMYPLCVRLGTQTCYEHSGKRWVANGLLLGSEAYVETEVTADNPKSAR